ncbi:MAG: hypothetical protein H7141_13845 [Burkholderiales bacterium]|nr:hypothetical protein [Bacteroidia bacterium]
MQEEKPGRKSRIPLSPEELYYFKKIKQLNEIKKIEDFKATLFYKIINPINIALAGLLSYCFLSILMFCQWQTTYITKAECSYGAYDEVRQQRTISEIKINSTSGEYIPVKTRNLFREPKANEVLNIGRDFIFHKILKVRLKYDDRTFWHIFTYPIFTICSFALGLGLFIYKVNKHLSVDGLLTVFALFLLAAAYFILI